MLARPAGVLAALGVFLALAPPAHAIPVFAHRYGLSCQACHTEVPHLTALGQTFLAVGYRLPAPESAVMPLAVKANFAYSSATDPSGIPKAIVDEVELLSGGEAGKRGSYFAEVYAVDGGRPGSIRDLWFAQRFGRGTGGRFQLRAGQFTLPLPVDPETFRETSRHYALYDSVVGANPFTFFAPHQGLSLEYVSGMTSASLLALNGHDQQSGIPSCGFDRMAFVQHAFGAVVGSAYRYDGTRPLQPLADRFWRQGYGLSTSIGALSLDVDYQHGFDTSNDGNGAGLRSSGGFVQGRLAYTARDFAIARYDATQDTTFGRSLVLGLGHRFTRNTRFTLEDVVRHAPQTANTLNAALLIAY